MNAIVVDERMQALWQAFLEARGKALASGRIEDGISAGKAWAAWLDVFAPVPGIAPEVAVQRQ